MSTISSRLLTDSKTLSSKTVVNSCSISVRRTTTLRESSLRSPRMSLENWNLLMSRIQVWQMRLRILVSISQRSRYTGSSLYCLKLSIGSLAPWILILRNLCQSSLSIFSCLRLLSASVQNLSCSSALALIIEQNANLSITVHSRGLTHYKQSSQLTLVRAFMIFRNQKKRGLCLLLFLLFLVATASSQLIQIDACLQFQAGACIRCSEDTHFYSNYCYNNIIGCKSYEKGSKCVECDESISRLAEGTCELLVGQGPSLEVAMKLYRYGNPADRYGDTNFIPISLKEVREFPTFMVMDSFIRLGEWGHFISKSQNPVYSVHYRITEQEVDSNGQNILTYGYKVLYEGAGGGLFLCLADVSPNLFVRVASLTVIEVTQLVDNCIDYDASTTRCTRCSEGYHLEAHFCYLNYGGCSKYLQNICLECLQGYLLVQNRCASDCTSVSDARSILTYALHRNQTMSTLSIRYPFLISTFYQSSSIELTGQKGLNETGQKGRNETGQNVGQISRRTTQSRVVRMRPQIILDSIQLPPITTFGPLQFLSRLSF